MPLTPYDITLFDTEYGTIKATFIERVDMTIISWQKYADCILSKINVVDAIDDDTQVKYWKITEVGKNADNEIVVIKTTHVDTKPDWVTTELFESIV